LKQVDNDGKFTYSKILFVKMPIANPLTICENPLKNYLQVNINLDEDKLGELSVFDLYGNKIKNCKAKKGSQQINIQSLAAGKYLLCLQTKAGEIFKEQIIIVK